MTNIFNHINTINEQCKYFIIKKELLKTVSKRDVNLQAVGLQSNWASQLSPTVYKIVFAQDHPVSHFSFHGKKIP